MDKAVRSIKFLSVLSIVLCFSMGLAFGQEKSRFWDDVQTIKKFDKIYRPTENSIVFVGSSSIRLWNDAEQIFAKYNVLNRGLGGTVVNDIIFYADELIFDYNPRQVVIYVGENDLGDGTTPADTIFARTKQLFNTIRAKLPEVPIAYISIKPSPGRDYAKDVLIRTNELILSYVSTQQNIEYVDVFKTMVNKDGTYRTELFLSDNIHMTPEGYKIWKKTLMPFLIKK
ncbi:Lysophospholipase L1 [Aquiflexum balticum DSM 16537]|uniref:Lysophospholipase L1 n=1 Tax=Aquiflexum balticum DSM 16537 TaxID=758820 RepID=A0A1W2H2Z8_9BACT|nr:GDSL-type esterase/lipase family protein [Aquiflexum balticum]SMD43271.1 Lysophospholipase L1 [Aquiflexum balticum DSM 16537]